MRWARITGRHWLVMDHGFIVEVRKGAGQSRRWLETAAGKTYTELKYKVTSADIETDEEQKLEMMTQVQGRKAVHSESRCLWIVR